MGNKAVAYAYSKRVVTLTLHKDVLDYFERLAIAEQRSFPNLLNRIITKAYVDIRGRELPEPEPVKLLDRHNPFDIMKMLRIKSPKKRKK